jgi:hypothetical protein
MGVVSNPRNLHNPWFNPEIIHKLLFALYVREREPRLAKALVVGSTSSQGGKRLHKAAQGCTRLHKAAHARFFRGLARIPKAFARAPKKSPTKVCPSCAM